MDSRARWGSRRRWGYAVWLVAAAVIAVPELAAAIDRTHRWLHFTTISEMIGHLERHHAWVELIVVAAIVFFAFSVVKLSPRTESGTEGPVDVEEKAQRTAGGRLTLAASAVTEAPREFDADQAPVLFAFAAAVSLVAIGLATWATVNWWEDAGHYRPAYVLYGSLALLWVVVPSLYAFVSGKDTPFPTLFRSVVNLEQWLRTRAWKWRGRALGPMLGWLVVYVIVTGLVILLLHLTLYPFPDITEILNPGG